jgi:hypothetical protein
MVIFVHLPGVSTGFNEISKSLKRKAGLRDFLETGGVAEVVISTSSALFLRFAGVGVLHINYI